jgi:hypothetical protein
VQKLVPLAKGADDTALELPQCHSRLRIELRSNGLAGDRQPARDGLPQLRRQRPKLVLGFAYADELGAFHADEPRLIGERLLPGIDHASRGLCHGSLGGLHLLGVEKIGAGDALRLEPCDALLVRSLRVRLRFGRAPDAATNDAR